MIEIHRHIFCMLMLSNLIFSRGYRFPGILCRKIKLDSQSSSATIQQEILSDDHFMKLALRHAQHSFREREVPIGAVIVDENGIVLATSRNKVELMRDATAHAEMECLRSAMSIKNNWRLSGCTLYSTLEPCAMCMAAAQASRIKTVVFGAPDHRLGAVGSWVDLVSSKHPFHNIIVRRGVLEDESSTLLKRFFQMRRREKNLSETAVDRGSSYESLI